MHGHDKTQFEAMISSIGRFAIQLLAARSYVTFISKTQESYREDQREVDGKI